LISIGNVNRMDNKREVSQVFNNIAQGRWLRGRPRTDGGTVYKQILIDAKWKTRKGSQKTEVTGRSPLRGEGPRWTVVPSKKKKKNNIRQVNASDAVLPV
jgi:hypothetical protein